MIENLPQTRGRLIPNRPLADLSWLRVGGPADVLFTPADEDDLAQFLAALPGDVPVFTIGVCSNLIIRAGGIRGVVIRLARNFNGVEILPDDGIRAGAAALDAMVAKRAAKAGLDLAFLRTIPGTIGGAVAMNAGCYGSYMADICESIRVVLRDGSVHDIAAADLNFSYRHADLPEGAVVVSALLRPPAGAPEAIVAKMEAALASRAATQPVEDRSCGSTFRNPAGFSSTGQADDVHDLKAWKLIDDAGMRGFTLGGAQMSPKHPNFLINANSATPDDLENLGELVRKRVFDSSGITLQWEIRRVGERVT
ncbi:MAG: UDP-N-acetylmuramate dehydrogenase [Paracoccaceae bacterium]